MVWLAAQAAWTKTGRSQRFAASSGRCAAPGALVVPRAIPAHEHRWPAVGNRAMSMPISATITSAAWRFTPGIVTSRSDAAAKGAIAVAIRSSNRSIRPSRYADVVHQGTGAGSDGAP